MISSVSFMGKVPTKAVKNVAEEAAEKVAKDFTEMGNKYASPFEPTGKVAEKVEAFSEELTNAVKAKYMPFEIKAPKEEIPTEVIESFRLGSM